MKIALGDWGFFYVWIILFNIIGIIFENIISKNTHKYRNIREKCSTFAAIQQSIQY